MNTNLEALTTALYVTELYFAIFFNFTDIMFQIGKVNARLCSSHIRIIIIKSPVYCK